MARKIHSVPVTMYVTVTYCFKLSSSGSKAQQLIQGMQSDDEGQQLTSAMEMCQVPDQLSVALAVKTIQACPPNFETLIRNCEVEK